MERENANAKCMCGARKKRGARVIKGQPRIVSRRRRMRDGGKGKRIAMRNGCGDRDTVGVRIYMECKKREGEWTRDDDEKEERERGKSKDEESGRLSRHEIE